MKITKKQKKKSEKIKYTKPTVRILDLNVKIFNMCNY